MFGRNYDQAGILVEPSSARRIDLSNDKELEIFRNSIWYVEASLIPSICSGILRLV